MGEAKFRKATGIKKSDWFGNYWVRWSDALQEAGYKPNPFGVSFSEDFIIEKIISLIKEIGKFPVEGDIRIKKSRTKIFLVIASFYD